ncbi:hypothetical protein [Methylorubrum extorquens]
MMQSVLFRSSMGFLLSVGFVIMWLMSIGMVMAENPIQQPTQTSLNSASTAELVARVDLVQQGGTFAAQ